MSTAATTVQLNRALYMQQAVRDAAPPGHRHRANTACA